MCRIYDTVSEGVPVQPFRRLLTALVALTAVLAGALALAAPASARGVSHDAEFFDFPAHYGNEANGYVEIEGGVNLLTSNASFATLGMNGYGKITKQFRVRSVQVDFVRLGIATGSGGVLAQNTTPKNSGTSAVSAYSETVRWTPMRDSEDPSCTGAPFAVWVRVGFSIRWTDGALSRFSVLGPRSTFEYCRP